MQHATYWFIHKFCIFYNVTVVAYLTLVALLYCILFTYYSTYIAYATYLACFFIHIFFISVNVVAYFTYFIAYFSKNMQNSDRSIFCMLDIYMQNMPRNMQNNMQNSMQKKMSKICNPVWNMQNSDRFIFCIFVIYMHSPLCWCAGDSSSEAAAAATDSRHNPSHESSLACHRAILAGPAQDAGGARPCGPGPPAVRVLRRA